MSDAWRNRIIGSGEEAPEQLLANPWNWRIHPKKQQQALDAEMSAVGWVQQVIVNQASGHVVDGHLRVSLAISRGEPTVPVLYVDLDEQEEKRVLATLDPLAALAGTDQDLLTALIGEVGETNDLLAELAAGGLGLESLAEPPPATPKRVTCPECGHEFAA